MTAVDQNIFSTISRGEHNDPFSVLGSHEENRRWVVRTFQPQAESVCVVDSDDALLADMTLVHPGVFEATIPTNVGYRLRLDEGGNARTIDDPYRFPSPLGEIDRHLMGEGTHLKLYNKLGARSIECDGVAGVHFAVWAPNGSASSGRSTSGTGAGM